LHAEIALNANRRRQPGQDATHFKTDSSSGRIIIDHETFKSAPKSKDPSDDIAGQAYREQMTGVDGFTRGPSGEVKFHKNTRKRRAEEAAAEAVYGDGDGGDDVAMNEVTRKAVDGGGKKKKIERVHLGQEFKAKVRGLPSRLLFLHLDALPSALWFFVFVLLCFW
jgi:ribosomal RNA-processing protein 12